LSSLSANVTLGFIYVSALLLIGDLRVLFSGWAYALLAGAIGAVAILVSRQLGRAADRRNESRQSHRVE
jgi:hypothetical protein